jgi:hypothetical protein
MGATKRLIEQNDEQERIATQIAVQAGVLERCKYHPEFVYDGGNALLNAYKKGAYRRKREKELQNLFGTQAELTDTIRRVVRANRISDECQRCVRLMRD